MIIRTCDMCGKELDSNSLRKLQIVNEDDETIWRDFYIENGKKVYSQNYDTIDDVDLCADCARKVIRFIFPKKESDS